MAETYTLRGHGAMVGDPVRMDAYQAALERAVRPGCVVLDIGAGTGVMSLLAARLGARTVYAVEPGDSLHLARAAARDNGVADRIRFLQDVSTAVTLPEPADVIVCDLRGVLPLFQRHIPSIADARARLLAPGGVLIPRADTLWAAPVEAPDDYRRIVAPWTEHARGLDLSAPRRAALNTWAKSRVLPAQLLAPPERWAVLDYRTITAPDVAAALEWTAERAGTAHGVALWFRAELAEGIGFASGPDEPDTLYGAALFPWLEPVPLREGDAVRVDLQARLLGGDYLWAWNTRVRCAGGGTAEFRQSTFLSQPVPAAALRRRAHDYRPALGEPGVIDRMVLEMMDGEATLDAIARALRARFPHRFGAWEDALSHAGRLSQAYARE